MDNLFVILAVGGAAFVIAFVAALLSSERVRDHGVFGALWQEVSSSSKLRNPYRG